MTGWLSRIWRDTPPVIESATSRDARALAKLHAASFHRGWSEDEFELMLAQHNALVHRLRAGTGVIGFAASRLAADEAEILSVAIASNYRGRGLSRDLLQVHLGHLVGRGIRTVFLEVEENNAPARRLYDKAGFAVVGRRERYYREPNGQELNALVMRRDLS